MFSSGRWIMHHGDSCFFSLLQGFPFMHVCTSLVVLLHRGSPRMGKLSSKTYAVSTHACAGKLIDVPNLVNKSEVEAE